jgi:iron complex outermembrane receptor protein
MFKFSAKMGAMLCAVLLSSAVDAVSLDGQVTDNRTGLPIPGVAVKIAGTNRGAISDSAGRFFFADLSQQKYTLIASAIGYEIAKKTVDTPTDGPIYISMTPKVLKGQDIIVTATRAQTGETPAAFSNVTSDDIAKQYWAQDIPMLLAAQPNVFAYSDAGTPIGYSYMKIRGYPQMRISVMLNGIPLNDAESHEVFWVDLPDFTSNVQDIQVQRGAGTSLYGSSALGGAINVVTNDFPSSPQIGMHSGYGSYNTKKFSIFGNSGLINDAYVFYGRYSKVQSDGYRKNSWTKMYSYFFGAARYDANMTTKFNTYGGPEESHLAYKGIDSLTLKADRRYNELTYEGEIDHFNQPHYELINEWRPTDKIQLGNTFYYFSGDGYYDQNRRRQDYEEFFPGVFEIKTTDSTLAPHNYYARDDSDHIEIDSLGQFTLTKVDIIKRRRVQESDWGWIPRLTIEHNWGNLSLGSEIRVHQAHHTGTIRWANYYPASVPDVRYYDYRVKSNMYTAYAQENFKLFEKLTLVGNIQYQYKDYRLYNEGRFNVKFKRNFDYLSPRFGANYQAAEQIGIYASISTASRPPAFKDIYDPQDYWSNPEYKPANFTATGNGWKFIGKSLVPEKLLDFEAGANLNVKSDFLAMTGSVNYYWMQMRDELIPYAGQIDDNGQPISGNADKTLHQGLEISFNSQLINGPRISGNISLNDSKFTDYTEYGFDYDLWQSITYDRSGMTIGGCPDILANYRIDYSFNVPSLGIIYLGLGGRYVGKQYIDNGEEYRLDGYHLLDGDISYDFGSLIGFNSLKASLKVNNITNKKYVASAYMDSPGEPRYIVGAPTNYYISLNSAF